MPLFASLQFHIASFMVVQSRRNDLLSRSVPPSVHRSPPCARAPPASNTKPQSSFCKSVKTSECFLWNIFRPACGITIHIFHRRVRKSFNLFQFVESCSVTEPVDQRYIFGHSVTLQVSSRSCFDSITRPISKTSAVPSEGSTFF